MKRTTWVIISLSLCVVVLASALGIVLLQKKTETIIIREPNAYTSHYLNIKPWQNFSLAPRPISINQRKGLTVYHNDKVTTYVITGGRGKVITPYK
ncbi:hypothetical protein ACFLQZ_03860 [Acidobacteriota bacterium]